MTEKEKELTRIIQSNIEQSKNNDLDKETNKFDFKSKWYNLKDNIDINEFLKDITSIVNTIGPTGYLVIGYDEAAKEISGANFKDSGLKDVNELLGIIIKRVDRSFDIDFSELVIEGKSISVIEIPPSIDKPHVIRHYVSKKGHESKNMIFVKNSTSTIVANKYHLDKMYYDRKNIKPEYLAYLTSPMRGFQASKNVNTNKTNFNQHFYIENIGLRPICVSKMLLICDFEIGGIEYTQEFDCLGIWTTRSHMIHSLQSEHLIINPESIEHYYMEFGGVLNNDIERVGYYQKYIETTKITGILELNNGKKISVIVE